MSGGAAKRAKRGEKAEAVPIIAYDSDMQDFNELVECSFVEVKLHNFSPGQSARAELSMWYREHDEAKHFGIAKKSWPVAIPTKHGEPIIAYDSDMFSEELGWVHQCSRVQVTLYDFSPGESARICTTVRMFADQDDDESEPDESEPVQNSAKSAEARAALRAAIRARECVNSMDGEYITESVIDEIEKQMQEMKEDEEACTIEEYDDIIKTSKVLETFYKNKAAEN